MRMKLDRRELDLVKKLQSLTLADQDVLVKFMETLARLSRADSKAICDMIMMVTGKQQMLEQLHTTTRAKTIM